MNSLFEPLFDDFLLKIEQGITRFRDLDEKIYTKRRNSQNRNIKQIIGHMIDSASNNIHRIIHLQYRDCPLQFPNYASNGNNDRWISIQNYEDENWEDLLNLWKYSHLHILHVIKNIKNEMLENEWISGPGETVAARESEIGPLHEAVTLKEMVVDFPRHFKLHLDEIDQLIYEGNNTKD